MELSKNIKITLLCLVGMISAIILAVNLDHRVYYSVNSKSEEIIWEDEFLSWIRYQDYSIHSNLSNSVFTFAHSDTLFSYSRRSTVSEYRRIVTWQGDTLQTSLGLSCGIYFSQPHSEVFSDYDTTLVRFDSGFVVPLKVGNSPIVVHYTENPDTLEIIVSREDKRYSVEFNNLPE